MNGILFFFFLLSDRFYYIYEKKSPTVLFYSLSHARMVFNGDHEIKERNAFNFALSSPTGERFLLRKRKIISAHTFVLITCRFLFLKSRARTHPKKQRERDKMYGQIIVSEMTQFLFHFLLTFISVASRRVKRLRFIASWVIWVSYTVFRINTTTLLTVCSLIKFRAFIVLTFISFAWDWDLRREFQLLLVFLWFLQLHRRQVQVYEKIQNLTDF